ncbi:beta-N-acetylhexosaminidase [Micromonospora nigra]|uniref:Beta-N-acetylhexosaminidase n=1 Tax=Micromonospora nigra TaxID=145857 RepID=A0A1C6SIY7_9ACTN|nr:glycoside hydrolase family 3 N-terminal domain-containing protein [Micromonospora nigra]SCL29332.1 beta-N-acetylhexosaminidase [Micromonospora nigra]
MGLDAGLRRLVLGTLLAAYPGPVPPAWAVGLVADGLAGHTLFGTNVHDPAQLAAATAALRAGRPDVLVAIDEEGGDVTRLAHATGSPYPGNAALGAIDDPALTREVYAAIGAELAAAGITVNLAPTVDVNTADENPVIGTRSFGADPERVATHTAAAVRGLQDTGVAACAKHFPGHGATVADSHHELPLVDAPLDVLRRRDLPPFAAAVAAGTRAVMTAHIRVPALTGDDPATFSRAVLVDLLRGEYGFTGAVVTDALEMKGAAVAAGGIGPAAVRALAAGADLLCIGAKVDASLVEHVVAAIVAALGDGSLDRGRVEQAAGRAADLAAGLRADSRPAAPAPELGYAAARRAVRVEGASPGWHRPLVVQLHAASTIAEGRVPWGLGPHLADTEQVRVVATETDAAALRRLAGDRPIVLVGRHLHRLPGGVGLVSALAAEHPVAVVEMGWPATWRPAGVRAFVTTYGASHANGRAAAEALGLAG